jgi:PKD repeat protein
MKLRLRGPAIFLFAFLLHGYSSAQDWSTPLSDATKTFYQVQADFYQQWGGVEQQLFQAREDDARMQSKFGDHSAAVTPMPSTRGGYKQFKRWEYYMEPRCYPSGDLSLPSTTWTRFQDYLNSNPAAMQQYLNNGNMQQQAYNPNNPNTQATNWTFVGPTGAPTGGGAGRLEFVRFDPTNTAIMYVGAPAGGLWKSTNSGTSWATTTDFLSVIGVSDLAIDPTNTNTMYIATGDGDAGDTYSIGVMKSTDGGVTWNATGLTWTVNQGRTISKLLINPTNTQILIAATSNGIYRTTNGGTSWTQVQGTYSFKDAEFKPADPNTVYAIGTRLFKSTDAGATWTNITSGLPANTSVSRMALAVTAANSAYVYVLASNTAYGFQGFYRSTDSGTTFTSMSTTPNLMGWSSTGSDTGGQGWYDLAVAASPTNQDVVVVGGVNIWRSTNGGASWAINGHWTGTGAPYVHADVHDLIFLPGSGTTYYAGCDGGIFRTTNSGGGWTDISNNLCIAQIYRIGLSNSNASLWITGHQDNGTNLRNGAAYSETMGGDGMDCFIDRTNNNVMYGSQYSGSLNRSTNGGGSWSGINSGLSGTAPWVTSWYQDPTTANTIYCGRTNLFKSTNQGTSWTMLTALPTTPSGTIVDFKVAPSNNQTIYVARSSGLFKTINGGTSWTTVTGTLPVASAAITRVDVKPNDPNTVYVTFSGYSSANKVFKTINGGTSWTNISTGLPNLPVNCVRFDPLSTTEGVYIGCDVGVYYIDNTFTTWQPYFLALPNTPVYDIEVYATTGKVRAATYGRGVWEVDVFAPGALPPVAQFTASTFITCVGSAVTFTDQSAFNPTSWSWTFPSATPASSTAQNPTGVIWNTAGTYTVTLTATNANGSSSATQVVTVLGSQVPPLVEGFESVTFIPAGWTANNANNDGVFWERATAGYNSTASARFDNYNNDVSGLQDEMWAPRLNLSAASTCTMTFDVSYARYSAVYSDTLQILVSTDCGTTWTSVWIKGGTTLATVADNTNYFTPTNTQWRSETINLNAYAGQSGLQVIVRNRGRYGNNIYVDNINITSTAAAPVSSFTASATSVCVGSPVNFTDNSTGSPTSWSWTFPSGTPASATTQNVTGVIWNTAGTYTVSHTATNASGSNTSTQTITVNALPTVATTATPTTICSGSSTTITATGAATYSWMPGSLTGSPVTVSPTSTTTYTVTGTAASGCTNTATRTITVNPSPTITTTTSGGTICSGSSTTITGNGGTSYTWMPGNLTGTTVTVSPTVTTTYTVTGTAANGCTNTATRTITVNPTPTITVAASPAAICVGNSTTMTATGGSTYTWMPGNLSGTSVTVTPTVTTTYTVTGTAANGCTNTAAITITVNSTPTVTATAGNATICSGSSTTLTGAGATTYTWMPGSLTGTTVTVTPASTTTYTVTGSNGCTGTATITVTVNPTPTVTTTASPTSVCAGNSSTITATGATSYSWMPGNLTGSPVTVTPASTTTYTVTGTSANGCIATATRTITVNPSPTVTATATNTSICTGGTTTLSATGATTYNWQPGNHNGANWNNISPATTTTYTVTGTSAGCTGTATITITVNPTPTVTATASPATICAGSSSTVTATGATTYTWNPGNISGSPATVTPASTTTYTVTGANGGCTATRTVTVTVNPSPTVSVTSANTSICVGNSTTLTASGGTSYTWNPGSLTGTSVTVTPTATTTYTVTGTAANGCTNSATILITVNPTPTVSVTSLNSAICDGSSETLTASGATTYNWMPGSLSGSAVTVTPSSSTTYTVTGTNGTCSATATISITVNPAPTVSATASNTSICSGSSVTLTGSGATSYDWQPGNLSGSSITDAPLSTTTYTMTGTDANGCTSTANVTVTVNPTPTVTLTTSSASICTGSSVTLNASGASTYNWMPGNISGSSVTDSPAATTTYTATGTDANGCTATEMITVTVYAQPPVTATGNNLICPGFSTTLYGGGGTSYVWQPGGFTTDSITVTPVSTTTYTVTGTDAAGCTNTATITVTIDTLPATPSISVVGNVLTSTVTGTSYQWFLNGNPIVGATSQSHTAIVAGNYTVEVYSAAGCGSGQSGPVVITGISANGVTDYFSIFPNPSDGHFQLTFSVGSESDYVLEIHDMFGQIIYTETLKHFSGTYSKEIDLSIYARGVYSIRLKSNDGETVIRAVTY